MMSDETITIQYKRYHHLRTITSLLFLILAIEKDGNSILPF